VETWFLLKGNYYLTEFRIPLPCSTVMWVTTRVGNGLPGQCACDGRTPLRKDIYIVTVSGRIASCGSTIGTEWPAW
jgi:hypothetical protein